MPRSPRQGAIAKLHTPSAKLHRTPVGADDPVRPLGNGKIAAMYRKNGRASCGSMWASTPTNAVRFRIGTSVFCRCIPPGGQRRPPLRVHTVPHWCSQISNTVPRGGASPAPTLRRNVATAQNGVGSDPFRVRFAHPPPLGHQGEAWACRIKNAPRSDSERGGRYFAYAVG